MYSQNTYLAHYGVKGQKYGVRRYQNKDMSLTEEGRIHYGVGPARAIKGAIEKHKAKKEAERKAAEEAERKHLEELWMDRVDLYKKKYIKWNNDLRQKTNSDVNNLEKEYQSELSDIRKQLGVKNNSELVDKVSIAIRNRFEKTGEYDGSYEAIFFKEQGWVDDKLVDVEKDTIALDATYDEIDNACFQKFTKMDSYDNWVSDINALANESNSAKHSIVDDGKAYIASIL